MTEAKLTKSQRRRRNERTAKSHAKRLGPIPDWAKNFSSSMKPITDELQAWQKAPRHMVDYDIEEMWDTPTINSDAQKELTEAAAKVRTEDKEERMQELKLLYPKDWKRRSGAKRIASFELDAEEPIKVREEPIKVRTVQRYIKTGKQGKQEPQN
jgi:hypothetical protein